MAGLGPDFVSVTFGAGGSTREGSRQLVEKLKNERKLEVVAYFAGYVMGPDDIIAVMDDYKALGIENVLVVRGDLSHEQEDFEPHPQSFGHASDLVAYIRPRYSFCLGVAGYHMGSDGYVWAREFTSLEAETPRAFEIEKHWYKFMLWGRLGYDLDMKPESIEKILVWRFPETNGLALYDTWATASKIIPLVNRFHWRNWDYMWAVEGCIDQRKGFHTVRDFITNETMLDSGMMSIREYVNKLPANESALGETATTPIQVAEQLQSYSGKSLEQVELIRRRTTQISRELRLTLGDIEAMSHLGGYYGSKILGATELHLFERSKDRRNRKAAIRHLLEAQRHWENYASVAAKLYKPQLLARTRVLDWVKILDDVRRDVKIAKQSKPKD